MRYLHACCDFHRPVTSSVGEQAFLVCGIRLRITAPRGAPKTTRRALLNFNERVASDTFFFLAADGVRWGVIHYVGDLVDLQAGGLVKHSLPQQAADVLNDKRIASHGPPDTLVADQGPEYHKHVRRVCDLFAVHLDYAVGSAKWTNGKA